MNPLCHLQSVEGLSIKKCRLIVAVSVAPGDISFDLAAHFAETQFL